MRLAAQVTITWNVNWPALVESSPNACDYEIERAGDAVRVTLTQAHDRPIDDEILSGGRQGWPAILSSLKSLLETGPSVVIKLEPAAADARSAEEIGDRDAVADVVPAKANGSASGRPMARPGPYAAANVVGKEEQPAVRN